MGVVSYTRFSQFEFFQDFSLESLSSFRCAFAPFRLSNITVTVSGLPALLCWASLPGFVSWGLKEPGSVR